MLGISTGRTLPLLILLLSCVHKQPLSATVLDFETLTDGESLTTQFSGLTFTNTIALQAGVGLNEFEFPPRSGSMVVSDDGGPISITFDAPITSFSGYVTYFARLTAAAYDSMGNLLTTATSQYSSNLACFAGPPCFGDPGSSPNDLLLLASAVGIHRVLLTADQFGTSFALDDLTYTTDSAVPEPGHFALFCAAVILGLLVKMLRTSTFGRDLFN